MQPIITDIPKTVLDTLRAISARKNRERIYPDHVLLIRDRPYEAVANLCSYSEFIGILEKFRELGLIKIGRTINDTWIAVIEHQSVESNL